MVRVLWGLPRFPLCISVTIRCSSGEGCFPEEVRFVSQLAMNVDMAGCGYRDLILPICVSLLLVTLSSSLGILFVPLSSMSFDLLRSVGV